MLLWLAHKKRNTGFTLIEMLVTFIIIGVIASIAAPNLLGLLNRNRVNSALEEVEGAIKEAQKQAIKTGKTCQIDINDSSDSDNTDNAISGGCLLSTRSLNELVRFNANVPNFDFSGKGNPDTSPVILVVSMANGTNQKKCLVMEGGLGIMRTGDYDDDPTATLDKDSCTN
jgi:prepilin-type N-terminal cleavage/methylation domain-containing protein